MLALPRAIGGRQGNLLFVGTIGQCAIVSADLEPAVRTRQVHHAARGFAVDRRQIAPSLGRESVKHGADELEQRRFARFVRTIEDIERVAEFLDPQSAPNAVPVDFQIGDFHLWASSPLNRSTPNAATSRKTLSRTALLSSTAAGANKPARCDSDM